MEPVSRRAKVASRPVVSARARSANRPPPVARRLWGRPAESRCSSELAVEMRVWRRFFRGDRVALNELAMRFGQSLLARVRRRLDDYVRSPDRTSNDPEDVLQRLLLELWQRPLPVRVNNVEAYVEGVIDKAVRTECRRQRAIRNAFPLARVAGLDGLAMNADWQGPECEWIQRMDAAEEWGRLVRHLTPRECVLAQFVRAGLNWQAIGQRLAIRPSAARMRFFRLAARLRRCLEVRQGIEPENLAADSCRMDALPASCRRAARRAPSCRPRATG